MGVRRRALKFPPAGTHPGKLEICARSGDELRLKRHVQRPIPNAMTPHSTTTALLFGTLSIATLHALIPSHWLAFALVGRSQRWSVRRTLAVTLMAGGGHVLLTVMLGLFVAGIGKRLQSAIPLQLEHAMTAILLIALGLYYLIPALQGREGCHNHDHHHDSNDEATDAPDGRRGLMTRLGESPTIMGALVLGMTLSPCLDLLSIYVAAASLSWSLLLGISLLLLATTLGVMTLLVWLTLRGLQRLNLGWLDRNEGAVMGVILIVLGVILFFV